MNTRRMSKDYVNLTPRERVPLMVAALSRGDYVELDRLGHSAPKVGYKMPDFSELSQGLQDLAMLYMLRQLAWAVQFERLSNWLDQDVPRRGCRADREFRERTEQI